jgi:hypothetical protein
VAPFVCNPHSSILIFYHVLLIVDDVMGLSIVASSQVSQALSQNSFAFQFGSISPGFGSLGVGKSTAMSVCTFFSTVEYFVMLLFENNL